MLWEASMMGALDPIRMTDKLDDALLDVLVARS
jgi:hypothetical protein